MKKLYSLFIFIAVILFIYSCGSYFNPKYYFFKSKVENNGSSGSSGGNSGIYIQPGEDEDPFTAPKYASEWWNDPNNGGFDASDIDSWFLKVEFLANDYPSYRFLTKSEEKAGHVWVVSNEQSQAYLDQGEVCNTTAVTGVSIKPVANVTGVTYTKYKGLNARFFTHDGDYHNVYPGKDKISRFYFYYFTGTPEMAKFLENCLIAVDTYSKLLFYYGRPQSDYPNPPSWQKPSNLVDKYSPTGYWISIDEGINDKGQNYPFYEYDPVGYVKSDGTVVIFDWFANRLRGNHNNDPIKSDPKGAIVPNPNTNPSASTTGRSPYAFYSPLAQKDKTKITISTTKLINYTVFSYKYSIQIFPPSMKEEKLPYAYIAYASYGAAYQNESSKSVEMISDINKGEHYGSITRISTVPKIDKDGGELVKEGSKSFELYGIDTKDTFIELSLKLIKNDENTGYVDQGTAGTGPLVYFDKTDPILVLKYDKDSDSFKYSSVKGNKQIEVDSNLSIKRGENKEFTVKFKDSSNGNEFGVVFKIDFEKIS